MSATAEPLYVLTGQMIDIERMLEESGGELTPDIEEALDKLEMEEAELLEQMIHSMKNRRGKIDAIDAEIKRLEDLKDSHRKVIFGMERKIFGHLKKTGRKKLELGSHTLQIRVNGGLPRITPDDPDNPPPEYCEIIPQHLKFRSKIAYESIKDRVPKGAGVWNIDGLTVKRGEKLKW